MSARKKPPRSWTSATAPRQGSKPGRCRAKLSAQAMQILDRLQADWMKHGATVLKTLRIEQPQMYAKLALEAATRLTLAESAEAADGPMTLIVRWRDPSSKPIAPELLPPEPPPRGPQTLPRLVSFTQPLDQ